MGVTWALLWAVMGVGMGAASLVVPGILETAFFRAFDAPLPALGVPGFFGGLFFAGVLGLVGHNRRFRDLSLAKFAGWGAAGGVLLSLFPLVLLALGLVTPAPGVTGASLFATAVVPFALFGAISAAVTLAIARAAERRSESPADDRIAAR